MNWKEKLNKLHSKIKERVEYISFRDSEEDKQRKLKELKQFTDNINKYAMLPIDWEGMSNKPWLSEQAEREQDNPLWKHLSSDRSSEKYFESSEMDPTEGIFFVDTDFLISRAGNAVGGLDKEKRIRDAFEKGIKLPTPQYWLTDNNLGEGNHRVMVAKEFGLKSVPVRVYWKG